MTVVYLLPFFCKSERLDEIKDLEKISYMNKLNFYEKNRMATSFIRHFFDILVNLPLYGDKLSIENMLTNESVMDNLSRFLNGDLTIYNKLIEKGKWFTAVLLCFCSRGVFNAFLSSSHVLLIKDNNIIPTLNNIYNRSANDKDDVVFFIKTYYSLYPNSTSKQIEEIFDDRENLVRLRILNSEQLSYGWLLDYSANAFIRLITNRELFEAEMETCGYKFTIEEKESFLQRKPQKVKVDPKKIESHLLDECIIY